MQEKKGTAWSVPRMHNHYHIKRNCAEESGRRTHRHECFEVFYVIAGTLSHKGERARVELMPGDALIVPPGHAHSTRIGDGDRVDYYTLTFKEELFHPGFVTSPAYKFLRAQQMNTLPGEAGDVRLKVTVPEEDRETVAHLLAAIEAEYKADRSREFAAAGSLTTAVLLILARVYFGDRPKRQMEEPLSRAKSAVQQCIRYIDGHYAESLTIDDLCRMVAVSRSVFVLAFTEATGMPVKRYINQKRIERAKELCAIESLSIKEIASLVGYQDFSTFYRNFRKYAGVSPEAHRQTTAKDAPVR